jgi:hypothetical protein
MADDAVNRGLTEDEANPFLNETYLKHFGTNDVRLFSAHDIRCMGGIDRDLKVRTDAAPPSVLTGIHKVDDMVAIDGSTGIVGGGSTTTRCPTT